MKKNIYIIILFFVNLSIAKAQIYTSINTYGQKHLRLRVDSAFAIPNDTSANTYYGSLAYKNNRFYGKFTNKWKAFDLSGFGLDTNRIAFLDKVNAFYGVNEFFNEVYVKNGFTIRGNNNGGIEFNVLDTPSTYRLLTFKKPKFNNYDTVAYEDWVKTYVAANAATPLTFNSPLTNVSNTVSIPQASISQDGYLSSSDWNNFNSKPDGVTLTPSTSGDVTGGYSASGTNPIVLTPTFTIGSAKVTTTKIASLAVTDAKINDVAWSKITGKPTTLSGYGITDALSSSTAATTYLPLTGGTLTNRLTGTSLILNKDSLPITTSRIWGLIVDTSNNNRISRQILPTAANPSSTVGTTAINGSASTFMRSDAAPAINLGISPTWTGSHTFNNRINSLNDIGTNLASYTKPSFVQDGSIIAYAQNLSGTKGCFLGAVVQNVSSAFGGQYVSWDNSLNPDWLIGLSKNVAGGATDNLYWMANSSGSQVRLTLTKSGSLGLGVVAPTSWLHLQGGTTSVSAIRLSSGAFVSTPQSGAIETDGNNDLFYTNSLGTRARVDMVNYTFKTANYTATLADYTIDCSGTFTVTLPSAVSTYIGRTFTIKNSGSGTITIATTSSQTIDGASTRVLSTQYSGVTVQTTGANWIVIATF